MQGRKTNPVGGEPRVAARTESGAAAVEYALMVFFIAAVIIATVVTLGSRVEGLYDSVGGF